MRNTNLTSHLNSVLFVLGGGGICVNELKLSSVGYYEVKKYWH